MGAPDAFFLPGGAGPQGERFVATEHARGPWSAVHQHGGPPSALLARAVERAVADEPFAVVRLTVELMAPVPLAVLDVATSVLRAGRKVRRIEATLSAEGRPVARATGLAVRTGDLDLGAARFSPDLIARDRLATAPPDAAPSGDAVPPPEVGVPYHFPVFSGAPAGYGLAVDARRVRGGLGQNPTTVWIRSRVPLVAGEATSPLQRVMIAADSGNGIAIALDPRRTTFLNADLTVAVHRPPVDEWVCVDSSTTPEPSGIGLTASRLLDRQGPIGMALQSLVVEAREGGFRA
jgi:hypothetical protein